MNNIQISQFKLRKVKLIKNGGLEVDYTTSETSGNTPEGAAVYEIGHVEKSTKLPHPDLTEKLLLMKPMVARVFSFSFFRQLIQHPDFAATSEQSRIAERMYQEIIGKISITGISISGEDANEGCIITATFLTDVNNNKTAINIPRVKFNSLTFGWEEELQELCQSISQETFEFLFENKIAEPELMFNDDEVIEDDAPDLFAEAEEASLKEDDSLYEDRENDSMLPVEKETEDVPDLFEDEPISDQDKSDEQREEEANA